MRASFLIGIGVVIGFSMAGLLYLVVKEPEAERMEKQELRSFSGDRATKSYVREDPPESSSDKKPGLKNRRPVAEVKKSQPFERVQSNLLLLNFLNRDGKSLPESQGILLGPKAGFCLLSMKALEGAVFARARIGDNPITVLEVSSRREDQGLVVLKVDWEGVGSEIAGTRLEPGQKLFAISPSGLPHPVTYKRSIYDSSLMRDVLDFEEAVLARETVVLINEAAEVQALVMDSVKGRRAVEIANLNLDSFSRLNMSVADYESRFYAGSKDDLLAAARLAYREGRYADAVEAWRRLFTLEPFQRDEYLANLEEAWRALLRQSEGNRRGRYGLLKDALSDLPTASDLWLDLGQVAAELGQYSEAMAAYRQVAVLSPERGLEVYNLRSELYYQWAEAWIRAGRSSEAYDILYTALEEIRDNAQLWLLFGQLSERRRDYAAAANSWRQAILIDGGLAASLAADIARAERLVAGPGRFVLDYDPRDRSMRVQLNINGRVVGEFIVDTGATVSMVPDRLAQAAGLDTSSRVPRVRLDTAGSSRLVPFSPTSYLELGGLRVEGLSVVVGNLSGNADQGLLGMDFLQNFHLENDTTNGRLVLSER